MRTDLGLAGIARAKKIYVAALEKRRNLCEKKSKELLDEAEKLSAEIFTMKEAIKEEEEEEVAPSLPFAKTDA